MRPLIILNQTEVLTTFQYRSISDSIFWVPLCTSFHCLNHRREKSCNFLMFIFSQVLVEKKIKHLWERSREWDIWENERMLPLYFPWFSWVQLSWSWKLKLIFPLFLFVLPQERKKKKAFPKFMSSFKNKLRKNITGENKSSGTLLCFPYLLSSFSSQPNCNNRAADWFSA